MNVVKQSFKIIDINGKTTEEIIQMYASKHPFAVISKGTIEYEDFVKVIIAERYKVSYQILEAFSQMCDEEGLGSLNKDTQQNEIRKASGRILSKIMNQIAEGAKDLKEKLDK